MRFFEAAPGRARSIKKNFCVGFPFFTSKWNYCRVIGPQNKIFIKNQLNLLLSLKNALVRENNLEERTFYRTILVFLSLPGF
jgi:hypothetical protein